MPDKTSDTLSGAGNLMELEMRTEKIKISGKTIGEIMALGCSRATAYRARKRGYFYKDYHVKQVVIDREKFDYKSAKDAANVCIRKYFANKLHLADELASVAMLRMYELSGISVDFNFQITVAKYAIWTHFNKQEKLVFCDGTMRNYATEDNLFVN